MPVIIGQPIHLPYPDPELPGLRGRVGLHYRLTVYGGGGVIRNIANLRKQPTTGDLKALIPVGCAGRLEQAVFTVGRKRRLVFVPVARYYALDEGRLRGIAGKVRKESGDIFTEPGIEAQIDALTDDLLIAISGKNEKAYREIRRLIENNHDMMTPGQSAKLADMIAGNWARAVEGIESLEAVEVAFHENGDATISKSKQAFAERAGWQGKISVAPNVSDAQAIIDMEFNTSFYVKDAYGNRTPRMAKEAKAIMTPLIDEGMGREEISKVLMAKLGKWSERTDLNYWHTVADNYITKVRSWGAASTMVSAGIETFVVEAVLDEVTTPTCFAPWTAVVTPSGERRIDSMKPGESVITGLGHTRRIKAVSRRVSPGWVAVLLSSGRLLTVTKEHPILTRHGWKTAGTIEAGEAVACRDLDMQAMRPSVRARQGANKALLFDGLLRCGASHAVDRSDVPSLRRPVQGSGDLCASWRRPVLRGSVPAHGEAARSDGGTIDPAMRAVRQSVHGFPPGTSDGQGPASLLQGLFPASWVPSLRDMRQGIRVREIPVPSLLFEDLLPEVEARHASRNAGGSCPSIGRAGTRRGTSHRQVPCGSLSSVVRDCRGDRWRLLAPAILAEAGCVDSVARGDADSGASQGAYQESRDYPVETYLGRIDSFVQVVVIVPIVLPGIQAWNLEVEDDPTYVAEGVVVHNCRYLHGKEISVASAMAIMNDAMKYPGEADVWSPFVQEKALPGGGTALQVPVTRLKANGERTTSIHTLATSNNTGLGRQNATGTWNSSLAPGDLESKKIGLPPYHHRCRSTVIPKGTQLPGLPPEPPEKRSFVQVPAAAPIPAKPKPKAPPPPLPYALDIPEPSVYGSTPAADARAAMGAYWDKRLPSEKAEFTSYLQKQSAKGKVPSNADDFREIAHSFVKKNGKGKEKGSWGEAVALGDADDLATFVTTYTGERGYYSVFGMAEHGELKLFKEVAADIDKLMDRSTFKNGLGDVYPEHKLKLYANLKSDRSGACGFKRSGDATTEYICMNPLKPIPETSQHKEERIANRDVAWKQTMAHELGHAVQDISPRAKALGEEIMARRIRKYPRKIEILDDDGNVKRIEYPDTLTVTGYASAEYGGHAAGVEYTSEALGFFYNAPMYLWEMDPEAFYYIVAVLRGI